MASRSAAAKYGMLPPPAAPQAVAPAASAGATAPARVRPTDNPVVWLTGIAAVMLGFIGVSTSARIGPLRGSVSVGKS